MPSQQAAGGIVLLVFLVVRQHLYRVTLSLYMVEVFSEAWHRCSLCKVSKQMNLYSALL